MRAGAAARVLVRHVSEVDIRAAKWMPAGAFTAQAQLQVVTCGRDSVRILRLKVLGCRCKLDSGM